MTSRQLAAATLVKPELTPARQTAAPEAQINHVSHYPLLGSAATGAGIPDPRAQAAALRQATGGRLARAGQVLLQLQQLHGNHYMQRVIQHASKMATAAPVIQAKLMLGAVGDRYEREADQAAEEVVRQTSARTAGCDAAVHRPAIQRAASIHGGAVDPAVQKGIQQARAGGQAISQHVRAPMEHALGADFRGVRLHMDDTADRLNRALRSRAFTAGQDIFFRRGEYKPGSFSTRRLLAHELTHVVQQNPPVARSGATDDASLQRNQAAQGSLVQCMFPDAPHAGDLDEINRIDNKPAGHPHKHQGVTSQPSNYVAPRYNIEEKRVGEGNFTAEVKARRAAYIGNCEATYLGKGAYDTGFLWARDPAYAAGDASTHMLDPHGQGGLGHPAAFEHVIEHISANVARGSKAAEQEHLNDSRYAYRLTLGAAKGAIEAVAGRPYEGTTRTMAKTAAERALRHELAARSHGNLNTLHRADWSAKYVQLFKRSGAYRDGRNYHLQTFVEDDYWNAGLANKLSQTQWGYPVHHVDVAPGQLRLDIPSRTVIDPHAHWPV
jgi:hypothetical protein